MLYVANMTSIKKDYEVGDGRKFYKLFDQKKKTSGASLNDVPAQDLHQAVIENFKRRKVYLRFKYDIWSADLAEMESLSSNN